MTYIDLNDLDQRERFPGFHGRFVHSDSMTFAHWRVDAGAALPAHAHPHEQVAHILDGEFEFTIGGETRVLRPGMMAIIPSNVPHSGRALTACHIVDVFYPVREDYRR